jgi:ribosomal protein L30/L7E
MVEVIEIITEGSYKETMRSLRMCEIEWSLMDHQETKVVKGMLTEMS